ncbi:MAG: hypothetical protein AAB225_22875, partial [Acidobacteriota bacterium]
MRRALLLLGAAALFAAYQYYYSDTLTTINLTKWTQNGALTPTSGGLTAPSANGGSLISTVAVPDGTSEYEVKTTLTLTASGGVYVHYLRASADAMSGPAAQGTYYAIELQYPTFSGSACTASLLAYKRVSGVVTFLTSTIVPCRNGMVFRSVRLPAPWEVISVQIDGLQYLVITDSSIATGKPGVGAYSTPAGNSIALVELGPADRVAPSGPNPQSFGASVFPNKVDLQWQGSVDDANGIGFFVFSVVRDGAWLMCTRTPELSDPTVSPSTTYTYTIYAVDYHWNHSAAATITVTTPPAGSIDPRQIGVRPLGAYWGAAGEQIDMRSGNLNFTLPLLRAQGRGGSGVAFALSYNSQLWRQDSGGTWKLGRDVGYGFGWRLQAGSITPYWSDYWTVHHYLFTDSSGAEYRLDVNTNGIWTSREGIYLEYDAAAQRLYFPDGSFWVMGAVSAGTEQDAGTRYPTLVQDSNGNQIFVRYRAGLGVTWTDSSARINEIEDVRAKQVYYPIRYVTYTFTYNTDPIPHLTAITNYIDTGERYTFGYLSQNLNSPFSPPLAYGQTSVLQSVTVTGLSLTRQFQYDAGGSGELTKITLPYGGYLRYAYRTFTYLGNRTLREVEYRYLAPSAGASELTYTLGRDPADSGRTIHRYTTVNDPGGAAYRAWYFYTDPALWCMGLLEQLHDRVLPSGATKRYHTYFWTQDGAGTPYPTAVVTILDPGAAYEKQTRTEQTLDTHGNVTQSKIYDYGSPVPTRTYTNTYLTGSNYTSRHIWNRLVSTSVSGSGQNVSLVANTYDFGYCTDRTGLRNHDSANYGVNFFYRANVTSRLVPGATTNFRYDITGSLVTADDNYGHSVSVTPAAGTNYAAPGAITTSTLTTSMSWTSFLGLAAETGPNSDTASFSYDTFARPLTTTSPHGAVTNYTYNNATRTRTATVNNRWTKTTMDGLGRTVKVETGTGTTRNSVVDREYASCACSPLGRLKRASQPYAPGGTIYWTTYTYDALGRVTSVDHPGGTGSTIYVYEGNTVKVTDPAAKWKKFVMDA